jgi:hypothetical protein
MTRPWLIAAIHRGPYLTLAPLEKKLGAENCLFALSATAAEERHRQGLPFVDIATLSSGRRSWDALKGLNPRGFIRGTSEIDEKDNPERHLAQAAARAGIPVFAVEDFPGNYVGKPSEPLDGLFVEFEATRRFHRRRGLNASRIFAVGNPRYANLKTKTVSRAQARRRYEVDGDVLLWAGQPDGDTCARTLKTLWPALKKRKATVLFRAHPRDPRYRRDGLRGFSGLRVIDVSAQADATAAIKAADIVATPFSSLAVEAGFLGTPPLFVLLDSLGKRYLRSRNGTDTLPWCEKGGAFLIDAPSQAESIVKQAFANPRARQDVLSRFQTLHKTSQASAGEIARRLS